MKLSPLYGKNNLFTRMTDGIVVLAQDGGAPSTTDTLMKLFPKNIVAQVLAGLYANKDTEWVQTIDEANPDSIERTINETKGRVNQIMERTDTKDGAIKVKQLGILFALSTLANKDRFPTILGGLTEKLKKIALIAMAPRFAPTMAQLGSAINDINIQGELTTINSGMEQSARESADRSPDRVSLTMLEGVKRGLDEASSLVTAINPRVDRDLVTEWMTTYVAPKYSQWLNNKKIRNIRVESASVGAFGHDVAIIMFIAMNPEIFSASRPARLAVGQCNARLTGLPPFHDNWQNILEPQMRKAIKDFGIMENPGKPASPKPTDPKPATKTTRSGKPKNGSMAGRTIKSSRN